MKKDRGEERMGQETRGLRIHYVEFGAPDLDAIKSFYAGAFGWTFTDWGEDYVSFEHAGIDGGFDRTSEPGRGGALVILYAHDLEDALERVRAAGGSICAEPFSFPGGRRFHFVDPAGNELAVWSEERGPE